MPACGRLSDDVERNDHRGPLDDRFARSRHRRLRSRALDRAGRPRQGRRRGPDPRRRRLGRLASSARTGPVPEEASVDRDALAAARLQRRCRVRLISLPGPGGRPIVLVGVGPLADATVTRCATLPGRWGRRPPGTPRSLSSCRAGWPSPPRPPAQAVVEGIARALPVRAAQDARPPAPSVAVDRADRRPRGSRRRPRRGAERGRILASATPLARDLANTPPAHLTAPRLADVAVASAPSAASRSRCSTRRRSSAWAAAACSASTPAAPRAAHDQADLCTPAGELDRRTWRSSARASCTTPAASASSRRRRPRDDEERHVRRRRGPRRDVGRSASSAARRRSPAT